MARCMLYFQHMKKFKTLLMMGIALNVAAVTSLYAEEPVTTAHSQATNYMDKMADLMEETQVRMAAWQEAFYPKAIPPAKLDPKTQMEVAQLGSQISAATLGGLSRGNLLERQITSWAIAHPGQSHVAVGLFQMLALKISKLEMPLRNGYPEALKILAAGANLEDLSATDALALFECQKNIRLTAAYQNNEPIPSQALIFNQIQALRPFELYYGPSQFIAPPVNVSSGSAIIRTNP